MGFNLGLHTPSDLTVYLLGGQRVNDGGDLYATPLLGDLPFTYLPFAAAVFRWLATLSPDLATILWQTANLAALAGVILLVLHERGKRIDAPAIAVGLLLTVAMLAFEPVRGSFYYGQINLLLLLLIACDILPRHNRWPGIGVGLAAGLKLTLCASTGLIFLLQRRWWAALISVAPSRSPSSSGSSSSPTR
ncbi:glycosyltransferase 87 family protein [Corynebacterium suedekumii]|nr:glycosyltransferase 87 family protein [Corynebacterium suedekumii]